MAATASSGEKQLKWNVGGGGDNNDDEPLQQQQHDPSFQKHRKEHYNEIEQLRQFRKEHPRGEDAENVKPVLKKEGDAAAGLAMDKGHLKWDETAATEGEHVHESEEAKKEFEEQRKRHYNEMEAVQKFRQEHPGGVLDEERHLQWGEVPQLEHHDSAHVKEFEEHRKQQCHAEMDKVRQFKKEHPHAFDTNRHLQWDKNGVPLQEHSAEHEKEFKEHRKQHYAEMDRLRKERQAEEEG